MTNWFMNRWGSGRVMVDGVHLDVGLELRERVPVRGSEAKNTDATTDFISTSMPAFAQACLTIACVFCRGALVDVWYTILRRLPSLARMPSAPRFHPAWSSSALALSTLNSHFMLPERNFGGAFR